MIRRFAALLSICALSVGFAAAQTPTPFPLPLPAATPFLPISPPTSTPFPGIPQPTSTPLPGTPQPTSTPVAPVTPAPGASLLEASPTPATDTTAPSPVSSPTLIIYTGQLLDVRNGYAYFTTGDAFKLANAYRLLDYATGEPTTAQPQVKMYARATFEPGTGQIVELALSKKRLPPGKSIAEIKQFAIVGSSPAPAPEIVGKGLTGRPVSVVFEVTVPPTTQLTDNVYIATDAGGWNAQELKLDRIDAYRYRASRTYASGTRFAWRVTRGSWTSVERGQDNLEPEPHTFVVREVDALAARATVYHWSDENPAQPERGPNAIPTPYNSRPFGGGPGGIVVPQIPTPRPTPPR